MPNEGDREAIGDFKMKKFRIIGMGLFAILICVNFTSCNGKEERQKRRAEKEALARRQVIVDSIKASWKKEAEQRAAEKAVEEERKAAERKRIEKERIKTESITAWGDAKFGMSPKEVKGTNAFKDSYKYVKGTIGEKGRRSLSYVELSYDAREKFNENLSLKVGVFQFYACFESEELTSIRFKCLNRDASYLNDIIADAQILSYHFTKKYGKPKFEKGSVSIFDFDRGREFTYAEWKIGDKTAIIFMGEDEYRSSTYYYRVVIYNSNFPTKPDLEEQEAIKKYEEKKKKESANYF